jgi:dTDP-L-rhamnose 4-epimerase
MHRRVLVTGGAGFIGAHVATRLLASGAEVRALDALHPQVHAGRGRPSYLPADVELAVGDLRDLDTVARALRGVDSVVHLAARVGVAQSMYRLADYSGSNALGTAVLLEALTAHPVERLVVASSMSVYGEGLYRDRDGRARENVTRTRGQLEAGIWEPRDSGGAPLTPVPTPETKRPSIASAYALDKYYQERLCLMFGATYGIDVTALRLFNVYGPYQALSNPYTGVLAIFASRLHNGRPPLIFEDGGQRRDFVSVTDVASAFALALETGAASGQVLNIGSGVAMTIAEVAASLAGVTGRPALRAEVAGRYRAGDIRHCFADISLARELLGYRPQVDFPDGLAEFAEWLARQRPVDHFERMTAELSERGLMT